MSKVGKWSTTAANNNSTPPDGWPEGQAPSAVNDCGREMMAAIKTLVNTLEYVDLDNTPSYLSATTFSLGAADTTNWEVGRRVKLFDATTLYGTIISVSSTYVQVRLDSGVLTSSLSSAALAVIRNTNTSLPQAAYVQQNVIINGGFDLWQRTASIASITNNTYIADRFKYEGVNTASVNIYRQERSANAAYVPSLASCGTILNASMSVFVSAADAAVAATDYAGITYILEGYDWRPIAHQPLGLSFQVNTNCSGVYSVAIRSGPASASFVANYTVSTINTWQRVFIPFPEAPTTPYTWNYSQSAGMQITWTLCCGSNYQATASSWTAANALGTASQVNFLASGGNAWNIADVRLKAGAADTPVQRRPFALELMAAQRYYEVGQSTVFWTADGIEELRNCVQFATTKRVIPTITLSGGIQTNVSLSLPVNATTSKFDHRVISAAAGGASDDGAPWIADAEL